MKNEHFGRVSSPQKGSIRIVLLYIVHFYKINLYIFIYYYLFLSIEFIREVKDSLMNAYKNDSMLENVILEVNSSRHAYNVSMENLLVTITQVRFDTTLLLVNFFKAFIIIR